MAYDARVLQILIASPGDVIEEREVIAEVIYEWNYVNSRDRSTVLLPLRWETHASPEMGTPPQGVINRQVVDHCDMAVGVFWTRLGTPTDDAESGTAEEIARVGNAGKQVMLYFSRAKVEPDSMDLDEYGRLKEFKKRSYPQGLVEHYSSLNDFREKFRRQLAIRISDLIADDSLERNEVAIDGHSSIALAIAEGNPPEVLSATSALQLQRITCSDLDEVSEVPEVPEYPNYGDVEITRANLVYHNPEYYAIEEHKRDYYRGAVLSACEQACERQLRLVISSLSSQGMRDLHLEIRVRARNGRNVMDSSELSLTGEHSSTLSVGSGQFPGLVIVKKVSENEWRMELNIPVVQAQRTVFSDNFFTLKATESSTIAFDATVYSSDTPPFALSTELEIHVEPSSISYRDILKQIIPNYDNANDESPPTATED